MKIVRLTTFLDFGGVEKRLVTISHIQDANEWVFCALNKGGEAESKIREQGKKVLCFHLSYRIPSLGTIYKLYVFFKKEAPQVVHTSGAEANFHGVLAAKLARIPVVVAEEIGIPAQSGLAKQLFRFIYGLSDYVAGNSQPVIDYLKEENRVSEKKLRLIPNPILFPELSETMKTKNALFNMVSVSRLTPVKNIESLLRVTARLVSEKTPVHYTLVGEGTHRSVLEQLVSRLGIENHVTFAGFQNNPYPYLQQSDLYVLSSFTEGFSNSLAEALYSGTPSLCTRVGAAEDIITDGENGWLVPPDNDEALAEKVKEIIALDENERNTIARKGRETLMRNFSLEKHVDLLMTLYKS